MNRPLSPHLQIYKPMLTMVMSIMHRITGVALYAGMVLLVWWLSAAAISEVYFAAVQNFFNHWTGRIILLGFTWALIHHMLGGLKHFLWDAGRGYDLKLIEVLAKGHIIGSIVLTLMLWAAAYGVKP